ncbi:MAG: hypothetical protein AAGF49_17100 [Pseudomonadota bacterium]
MRAPDVSSVEDLWRGAHGAQSAGLRQGSGTSSVPAKAAAPPEARPRLMDCQAVAQSSGIGCGVQKVFVLGDPAYYERLGFKMETEVATPQPIPDDWATAWQSISLTGTARFAGKLDAPDPWREPKLWAP